MKSNAQAWGLFAALAALVVLGGCNKSAASKIETATGAKAETVVADRYPLTGEITGMDVARKVLVVRHEEVKGYMPAMTMEFLVGAGDLAALKVGQRIRADMIPSKTGDFRLEKIWPDDRAGAAAVAAAARGLREDTMNRGKNAYREVGENAPDFTLYDQEGRVITGGHFRGKVVMMNFIFTRCPVATMCPASTLKMIATQKLAKEAGVSNIEFVSITLDPAYDTPGVLKEYATVRGIDTKNFSFLTGPENAIRDLLTQFGVIAEFEGDLLKHTLATLLIDERGKIIHRADGSVWEPRDFIFSVSADGHKFESHGFPRGREKLHRFLRSG
jgi:protein SCO1/2